MGTLDRGSPKVILVCGWLNAKPVHLAKFVRQYQTLFPTSTIILVRSRLEHLPQPSTASTDVKPAVRALKEVLSTIPTSQERDNTSAAKPDLLVHLFSNGGTCTFYHLMRLFNIQTGQASLPRRATIVDSAPSIRFVYDDVLKGIVSSLPRSTDREIIQVPAAQQLCAALVARFHELGPEEDYLRQWAELLNDPGQSKESRRLYLYSDIDKVNPPQGIEIHANEAETKGFAVRRQFFLDSEHISRSYLPSRSFPVFVATYIVHRLTVNGPDSRKYPERYWRAIIQTWEGESETKAEI